MLGVGGRRRENGTWIECLMPLLCSSLVTQMMVHGPAASGHHVGICLKCRISVLTPNLLNQNLHFNKMPSHSCTLKFVKDYSSIRITSRVGAC